MHISLTDTLEQYTKQKVASGLYNNASEVIRELLRLMIEADSRKNLLKKEVEKGFKQIEEGESVKVSSREE